MELIKIKKTYVNAKKETKISYDFYLILDNGNFIGVSPKKYGEKTNYTQLLTIAREVKNDER